MKWISPCIIGIILLLVTGCAIRQEVVPVNPQVAAEIEKVYVLRNFNDRLDPALSLIVEKLEQKGIPYEVENSSQLPPEARYHIEYDGEWNWDLADYLTLFRISLYRDGRIIGAAEYNAKMGGMRLDKWGQIEKKIAPIIDDFLTSIKQK
jgi:hypothetical protein